MSANHPSLYGFTRAQLAELLQEAGFSAAHTLAIWHCLYGRPIRRWADAESIPPRVCSWLSEQFETSLPHAANEIESADGLTSKYALRLADGALIETVRMLHAERTTACVSSQAGCALGCVFCATGQAGFTRNLTAAEIVQQAMFVRQVGDDGPPLTNVVQMGMGEPLLNYDAVLQAVEILCDSAGLCLGGKQITLSTVGIVPGIVRLADERRTISLAVSLHSADRDQRAALVPIARTWPLCELMDACRYYVAQTGRKIFFEWTLVAGQNDSPADAQQLAALVRNLDCQVNLIPLNPTAGFAGAPGDHSVRDRFREALQAHGVRVSIRQRRGIDVAAGCGQLAGAVAPLA